MAGGTAFGSWLTRQRRQQGITRQDLARRAECSEVLITKLESGTRRPSEETARLLGHYFRVPEDELGAFVLFARSGLSTEQVKTSGEPENVHPWRTLYRHRVHLPHPATAFIGREDALAQARSILGNSRTRLLTLLGPPGIGKTRLGLRVAESAAGDFPDGVYFVGLAAVREAGLVLASVARSLGVQETGTGPLLGTLESFLKQKRLLLLMDNFEQALSAVHHVSQLLGAAPGLKVVATSREPLGLRAERRFYVPLLAVSDVENGSRGAGDLREALRPPRPETTGKYEAVRLFVERARAAAPGFELTAANAGDIVELCISLDRLPLAIELAASRIPQIPIQAMLSGLRRPKSDPSGGSHGAPEGHLPEKSRLELLADGPRDLTARQRTLRGAIDWSYNLLSEGEQRLFRALSVFRGEFDAQAASVVAGAVGENPALVESGINSLISKSLLQAASSANGLSDSDSAANGEKGTEFLMLETIRDYAGEKANENGEWDRLSREHALYFMSMAEEAEPHLTTAGQQEWLDRLEDRYDNIRAALWWARTTDRSSAAGAGEDPHNNEAADEALETGLRTAGTIWRFWYVRGYISEGREQLAGLLGRLVPGDSPSLPPRSAEEGPHVSEQLSVRAKALNAAGLLAYRQGDYTAARRLQEESLDIRRRLGDLKTVASTLNNLGLVAYMEQDYAASRALYEESLDIRRKLGDKLGITNSLNNLGILADEQGDYAWARALYEESLDIRRELGDKFGVAASLNNLGTIAYHHADYPAARRLHEESLTIRRELNEKWGIAMCLLNLGQVAYRETDGERARQLYREAVTLFHELGDRQAVAGCLASLAGVESMAAGFARSTGESIERAQRAARLLGAADALLEATGAALEAIERDIFARASEEAHKWIGPGAWQAAWQEGRAMNIDQAVTYAASK